MARAVSNQSILLESGTNEVEVAEFMVSSRRYGVNVAKIREFIPFKGIKLTKMPQSHPSVMGVFMLRGKSIPLVDLTNHLDLPESEDKGLRVVVVTEFNNLTTSFYADEINRIHRVSWSEFSPLNRLLAASAPHVTGSIALEGNEVLILDLEHIVGEIFPQSIINYDEQKYTDKPVVERREQAKVVFAEDSTIIRTQVKNILNKVGYAQVSAFDNGQAAFDAISQMAQEARQKGQDIGNYLNVLVTDIEMPRLDGLSLCRKVKEELGLGVPVIMFSSLINDQMAAKCRSVGAEAFTNKPETDRLISLVDKFALGEAAAE